jgi:hopene-associated glycosyltransferase HpnB
MMFARADFWKFADRDTDSLPEPAQWPTVVAVIPARNEADVIASSLGSVLAQDYPGDFRVILVDDQSDDGTADVARSLPGAQLSVMTGGPRPPGWTGKLWALEQGIAAAGSPEFLWLTDADIGHAPDNLRRLIARAHADKRVMVSLMARLHCQSFAERALIPAFVYFFAMLYPFPRVNRPSDPMAGAAGGCVLIRRETLAAAGGIASIRHEIIDDCSLARRIKPLGPIWLSLSDRAQSLRPYSFDEIRRMVARSAYAQLGYSPLLLLGTLLGLLLVYAAPPVLAIFATGLPERFGVFAWLAMALTFAPILRFYRVNTLLAFALPLIALTYAGFTLDSAIQHWRGRGGMWKGRAQALGQA